MATRVDEVMKNPDLLTVPGNVKLIVPETEMAEVKEIQEEISHFRAKIEDVFPSGWKMILTKLPVLGGLVERAVINGVLKRFSAVADELNRIESKLSQARAELFKSQASLESYTKELEEFIKQTESLIAVGEKAKERFEEEFRKRGWKGDISSFFKRAEEKASGSELARLLEEKSRYEQLLANLSRLYQLLASLKQTLLAVHQIRKTNRLVYERLETLSTVGLSIIALQLAVRGEAFRQKRALELIKATDAFMEELTLKNAQTVKENTEIAGELQTKPMVAVKTLKEALNQIAQGFEEQEKNKERLAAALRQVVAELKEIENETSTVLKRFGEAKNGS